MNRFIQTFNLFGVIGLAMLCAVQWKTNGQLNREVNRLEGIRLDHVAKIAEQEKAIKGYIADLDDFRQRLTLSEAALKEVGDKLAATAAERDQLKTALDKWIAAVAARDAALKQANEQIQKLAADRNDTIAKFNGLAGKYNDVVKELNQERGKQ